MKVWTVGANKVVLNFDEVLSTYVTLVSGYIFSAVADSDHYLPDPITLYVYTVNSSFCYKYRNKI